MNDFNFTFTSHSIRTLPCGCRQYILTGYAFKETDREIEVRWWEKICGTCYFTGIRKQDKSPSAQWYHERKDLVYQMPSGDWAASSNGTISDGFKTRQEATNWVLKNKTK